jgi:hypothetical protein
MTTFDYTSRDYFSIKEDLLARASSVLPEWTSRDASDFGMLLVDLWAYMGDVLHYYIDRAAQEAFLSTATQRSSILAIASLLDYTPTGRTPATASITLNATNSAATDAAPILIPRYTRFIANPLISGADDVVFTSNRPIAFNESGTAIENYTTYAKSANALVTLTEGEIFTQSFTSDGLAGQRFTLNQTGVVKPSVSVTVNEGAGGTTVDYSLVDRFIDATNTDNVFSLVLNSDDSSTLVFGNGVYGKVPTVNATVSVYYRRSRGSAGNVDANTITEFESLTNTLGPPYDGIVITPNTVKASGGTNSESISSLQLNIPASFRSQDRAVSIQDYRDLTLRVSGISKSTASVVTGATAKTGYITNKALTANVATLTTGAAHGLTVGETIAVFDVDDTFDGTYVVKTGSSGTTLLYDLVSASVASASVSSVASYRNAQIKIYALSDQAIYDGTLVTSPTTSPLLLDNEYRDSIYSYIEPRQMVGVNTVVMPSVELTSAKVTITLNILSTYVQASVIDLVTTAIKSLISFGNVTFGQTISLGTLYRAIIDIDGVDYVTVDRFTTGSSAVIDTIGLTPVVKGVQAPINNLLLLSELVINASGGVV